MKQYIYKKLLLSLLLFIGTVSFAQNKKTFQFPKHITTEQYEQNTIIVKLESNNDNPTTQIEAISKSINGTKFESAIAKSKKYAVKRSSAKNSLSNIYKIHLKEGENLLKKINHLLQFDNVIYAEPYYLPKPLYIPNDPQASADTGLQSYLEIIKAYDAWEFEKGDSSIVIGILDTGIALDHEDITANVKYNYNDPINGIDDDGDGYVDNYHGWDMADNDNDPTYVKWHGLAVAGFSSATTDNGIGIAGIGFNSKFMPIKIYRNSGTFNQGYEAILYAAEQGCQVINLSWGSPESYSNYAKDIINYVVEDLDVVIVAAAGNTNLDLDFYPASYRNVLSVGASDNQDKKAGYATFSNKIDIIAPGLHVYTTKKGGVYGYISGSSFSSPMVAGVAALVRSRFPNLNARQVMQKIRLAADDIYGIPENAPYSEMLGKGRLNALKAVSTYDLPAIRMTDFSYENTAGKQTGAGGDTLQIKNSFINFLGTTSNATVTLSCESTYVTILEAGFSLGQLSEMEEKNNNATPFKIYIDPSIPNTEKLNFRLGFNDVGYSDYQYFNFLISAEYLKLDTEKVELTVHSNGRLPYGDELFSVGSGYKYEYKTLADHIGFAIGTSAENLVDNMITNFSTYTLNNGFQQEKIIKRYDNSIADIDVRSTFNDKDSIGLKIEQKLIASTNAVANDFIIIEYRITNKSGSTINDIFTGIFAEWNVNEWSKNKADWDDTNKLGYVFDTQESNLYTGFSLITDQESIYNAIDLGNENGNIADITTTFSKTEKFQYLTTSSSSSAGQNGEGNDVANMLSSKISLLDKESTKVTFVLVSGKNLQDIQHSVVTAKVLYSLYQANPPTISQIEICSGESTVLTPSLGINHRFYGDSNLTTLLTEGETFTTPPLTESQSYYVTQFENGYLGDVEQIKVIIKESLLDFSFSPDTLIISENSEVQFTDHSQNTISRQWIFEDGYTTADSIFSKEFNAPGNYTVKLVSENTNGCIDSLEKQLVVLSVTGLENNIAKNFTIYPNPSLGKFTIAGLKKTSNPTITILDTTGRIVYNSIISEHTNTKNLDLRFLEKGIYIIRLLADNIQYRQQKIILH